MIEKNGDDIVPASRWTAAGFYLASGLLIILIFYADLLVPLGIATGSLYIMAVLVSLWSPRPRFIIAVAAVSSLLVIAIFFLKHPAEDIWKSIFNRGLSLAIIWVTASLGLKMKATEQKLAMIASLDFLTGLFNRREIYNRLYTEVCRVDRIDHPFSVIMIDIDHFKTINDRYGHSAGDKALKQVAGILRDNLRDYDYVCRYGGEEFLVVTPETTVQVAHDLAERLRGTVMATSFSMAAIPPFTLTISAGVTRFIKGESIETLLSRADMALYHAKKTGRNRVVTQ